MKDILALEWEHDQLFCVQAAVSGSRVRIRRLVVLGITPRLAKASIPAIEQMRNKGLSV